MFCFRFMKTKRYRRTTNQCFNGTLKKSQQSKVVKYSKSVCKLNLVSILIRQRNFQCSQTGCICISIGLHKFYVFPNGIHRGAEKILFSNLNSFFSRHFKKILNGQKLDNLFIFQPLKFGGDVSKTVTHVFRFLIFIYLFIYLFIYYLHYHFPFFIIIFPPKL